MKFGPDVLLKIMEAVQNGLLRQEDISQALRDIDVVVSPSDPNQVVLSGTGG